jgi:hypothetical protein
MQYTALAVAIVLVEVYMKERFRDFTGIGNSNHFFQLGPLLHIIVIVIDKKNIYICRCYFITMKQALSQLFRAVSIKLFDFCLSLSLQLFKFDSSLKQAVNRN